jgi:hypothetical protein
MKKISTLLASLAISSLLLAPAYAGITRDTSLKHGHEDPEAFVQKMQGPLKSTAGKTLTVHVIPHSHDDVGWLKTVDEYFSGTKYYIQRANVELIIDNVMRELIRDKAKHFSQVEMKFFSMWWYEQSDNMKN